MAKNESAPVIIITGGTGSGKSTVAAVFKKMGARVIDVDRFAHRLLKPLTSGWHEIIHSFCGARLVADKKFDDIYQADDFIDNSNYPLQELPWAINNKGYILRSRLGAMVFSSPTALETLNKIIHPALKKKLEAKITNHKKLSVKPLVLDMAVYPEKIFRGMGDAVLWVRAPGGVRAQRLSDNRRMTPEEASTRIRIQWKDDEFKKMADFVLPNLGSDTDIKNSAEAIWPKLVKFARGGGK